MTTESVESVTGVAAGVPFIALPPRTGARRSAPLVVAWHFLDPPRTEHALAAALPLAGVDAWRIYLGLPMCGARLPGGGFSELMRLGFEDAVLNLHGPISAQAAEEFRPALSALRDQLELGEGPVGVLGGSLGAAVAQLVLAEGAVPVAAAVLVSPIIQLRDVANAMGRQYGMEYQWTDDAMDVARRLDFVARADEIARNWQPAVLVVVGENDDDEGFAQPARRLQRALASRYSDPARVSMTTVPGMGHALADEPGVDPAPPSAAAAEVDRQATAWLQRHLTDRLSDSASSRERR